MGDLVNEILNAPVDSTVVLALSIAYTIVESIRIYDVRLIQVKTRGFVSEVAAEAEGCSLPPWVAYIHFAGWVLFIAILIMNWKYAIVLYGALFLLRVLPVLERIGALIMSPLLQTESIGSLHMDNSPESAKDRLDDELVQLEDSIEQKETELVDAKIAIEQEIHSSKPGSKPEEFVPPFHLWVQYPVINELDVEDAIDLYIEEYQLLPSDRDESDDLAKRHVKCTILEEVLQHVKSPIREYLQEHLRKSRQLLAFMKKQEKR